MLTYGKTLPTHSLLQNSPTEKSWSQMKELNNSLGAILNFFLFSQECFAKIKLKLTKFCFQQKYFQNFYENQKTPSIEPKTLLSSFI